MKYVLLSLSIICLIASIVFIIRGDFATLPFGLFGAIMNLISFYIEVKDNE